MALIRRIGFTRFSRWGDNLGRLTVSAATHTDALDGTDELRITCSEDLVKGDRVVWVDLQGVCHEHIVDTIDRIHDDDGAPETQAVCINSINETWDDWLDDKRPSGGVSVALTSILAGTRWEVGTCDQEGSASRTFYHESVREGLAGIIETWGGELETTIVHDGAGIVRRLVGVRAKRGNQNSAKRFTWTKDLVSVKRTVASDNPKTRVYGYGKGVETEGGGYGRRLTFGDINGGKDYVEDAEATAVWGHPDGKGGILPAVASYVNEQCEDAAQLLRETQDHLEKVKEPKVTYTASVIDLYAFGRSWEGVGVGDAVAIIDKGFSDEGVRLHGRVSQIERNLLTGDATVTFGTLTDSMADMWQSVSNALKGNSQQNALYDAAAGTSVSWLIQLQQALNAQFNAVGTYHVETFELGEIWSNVPLDPETGLPVKATSDMWAINVNGRGQRLASGLTSDGQWDWRTFFTGGMVTADVINAGTMRAERVRAGLLTDEKGNNYWDLTSGDFRLASTATVGGKTVGSIADESAENALNSANAYTDALDEELDCIGVFDRLTDNGAIKCIVMANGQLFINADYINSGTLNADLLRAGRIQDKTGESYWDLDSGDMQLSFVPEGMATESDISNLNTKISTAQNAANSAKSAATAAQSTADSANSKATSAKTKTDRITFTQSGITVRGTDGRSYKAMTLSPDGLINDGSITNLKTADATLGLKDWGIVFQNNASTVRFWVSNNRDEIFGRTNSCDFLVNSSGMYVNGKKVLTE